MSKTTEKLENLKCTDDKEDVGDEHCYVHTCPTQSCTEVLRSLHSAKLQLECEVIKLQSELRCIKMHLEQKESFENAKEPRPVLLYCCEYCNGLLPSREDYSIHLMDCKSDCVGARCSHYRCEAEIFQKVAGNSKWKNNLVGPKLKSRVARKRFQEKLKEVKSESPSGSPETKFREEYQNPRKRTRREAARKLLVKWGKAESNDVPEVETSKQPVESEDVTMKDRSCKAVRHSKSFCVEGHTMSSDSKNRFDVRIESESDHELTGQQDPKSPDTNLGNFDSATPSFVVTKKMRPENLGSDVIDDGCDTQDNGESGTCSDAADDTRIENCDSINCSDKELMATQTLLSKRVAKVLECPQIRKLVRNSKVKSKKMQDRSEYKFSNAEKEHFKGVYQKYLVNSDVTVDTETKNEVSNFVYHCPKCPFVSKKCIIFHKHMMTHESGPSQTDVLKSDEDGDSNKNTDDNNKVRSRRQIYNELRTEWAKTYEQYIVSEDNVFKHYQCPNCSYKTTSSGHFGRHFKNVHNQAGTEGGDLWRCDVCEFETQKKAVFIQHKKCHDKPYLCNYCPRRFGNQKNLSDHILIHTGVQPLKCPHCEYATKQKRCLQEHIRKHTGETLLCTSCSFTTVYQSAMSKHILSKHTKKALYPCSECVYITNDRTNLQRHVQIHQKHKDFKCCHCNYEGVTKHDVIRHMRCHTQEKVYYCDRCDFSTAYPGALRTHLMMHLDLKPFKCSMCGYDASQKMRVLHHIQAKHSQNSAMVLDLGIKLNLDLKNFRRKSEVKREYEVFDHFDVERDEDEEKVQTCLDKDDKGVLTRSLNSEAEVNTGRINTDGMIHKKPSFCYVTAVEPDSSTVVNVMTNSLDVEHVKELSTVYQGVTTVTQDLLQVVPQSVDSTGMSVTPVILQDCSTALLEDGTNGDNVCVDVVVDSSNVKPEFTS